MSVGDNEDEACNSNCVTLFNTFRGNGCKQNDLQVRDKFRCKHTVYSMPVLEGT